MGILLAVALWPAPAAPAAETIRIAPEDGALQKALERVRSLRRLGENERIEIVLRPGVYRLRETLTITPTHTGEGGLLLRGDGAGVVLSGAQTVVAKPSDDDRFWRAELPDDALPVPRYVTIGERWLPPARYPNEGYLRIESPLEDRRSGFIVGQGDLPEEFDGAAPEPADGLLEVQLLHDWSTSRMRVRAIDPEARALRTVGPLGAAADHYAIDHFEKQPRYCLWGDRRLADRPGEWYWDAPRGQLAILPEEAEDAGEASEAGAAIAVELPRLVTLIEAEGDESGPVAKLELRNLEFVDTAVPVGAGGFAARQATMHETRSESGERGEGSFAAAAVRLRHAEQCVVEGCRFQRIGGTALWVGGRAAGCEVRNCEIDQTGGNGINLGESTGRRVDGGSWIDTAPDQVARKNRIRNCQIQRCGQVMHGAVAIWAGVVRELEIAHNEIHDCPYTGISIGWIWNDRDSPAAANEIHHNRIHHVMQILSDGGGIYSLGRQPDSALHHNWISDVPLNAGRAESNGMFLDEGTTGIVVESNLFERIDRSPLRFHRAGENHVRANLVISDGTQPLVRYNNTPEEAILLEANRVVAPESDEAEAARAEAESWQVGRKEGAADGEGA